MKNILVLIAALLAAFPMFAQSDLGADNCCQIDRSCATDAEWDQGWYDHALGLCGESAVPGKHLYVLDAETNYNNCCFLGRACSTDQEWDRGYYDWVNDLCGPLKTGGESLLARDAYTFYGIGQAHTGVFTLSAGKWSIATSLQHNAWILFFQTDSVGNPHYGGKCLALPNDWHWYGQSYQWFAVANTQSYRVEFVARAQCDARLSVYHSEGAERNAEWKVFLNKVDGNF